MIFDIENHFESPTLALCNKAAKLDKASQDAYNWGGWLILEDLLKNWVAKGVASQVNDFTLKYLPEYFFSHHTQEKNTKLSINT